MTTPWDPVFEALHSRPIAGPASCRRAYVHDWTGEVLSLLIIAGLIVSYLPQHYRIIRTKSSEGFSPFFLLLGATSSASSLLNIITLQWGQVECCRYLGKGECFESMLGIAQVFFQWFCFNVIFILYLTFYPSADKWVRSLPADPPTGPSRQRRGFFSFLQSTTSRSRASSSSSSASSEADFDPSTILLPGQLNRYSSLHLSPSYRHALYLFALTLFHLFSALLVTVLLLTALPTAPPPTPSPSPDPFPPIDSREHPSERAVRLWATVLGVSSVVLGCCQYLPQLALTFQKKHVGSLSIPMMCLQTPGSFVFVYTLAIRPGVNWTGWGTYLITGILQGTLLIMCLVWKQRQKRLGIDDWGKPLDGGEAVDERSALL